MNLPSASASNHQPSCVLADTDIDLGTQEMVWLEGPGCPLLDAGAISRLSPRREGIRILRKQIEGQMYQLLLNVRRMLTEGKLGKPNPHLFSISRLRSP